jgi:hypothetical protein
MNTNNNIKRMRGIQILIATSMFFLSSNAHAQIKNDSLSISGEFAKTINQRNEFLLKIIFTNVSKHSIQVYESLEEGRVGDVQRNFNLIIEKEKKGKFEPFPVRSYSYGMYHDDTTYRDVSRSEIFPGEKRTLTYDINTLAGFGKGKYRLKFGIRSKVVFYGSSSNNFDIFYEYSPNWIYFNVNDNFNRNDSLLFIN